MEKFFSSRRGEHDSFLRARSDHSLPEPHHHHHHHRLVVQMRLAAAAFIAGPTCTLESHSATLPRERLAFLLVQPLSLIYPK